MSLTNPGQVLERSCLLSISLKLLTLSGILPFSTNLFRLASLLALLAALNLFFLIGALLWFIKITKAAPFESVEVFRKDPFLALYFSPYSLMIFRLLCLLPSSVLFTLTIWPFGPIPPRSPVWWRPHKDLCFDWSAGLSTGVFLSIRENVRPLSSQWIPTRLTSNPTSSYSAPASVSIPLQLFSGSPLTALFPLLNMYLRWRPSFSPRLKALRCISASSWGPSKESLSLLYKSFLRPLFTYASPGWFPFLSATNLTKLERLQRAASRAITGCLSSSPIPLLLTEVSLPPLRVTLTHFTFLSYERALRLPTSFPISSLARLGVKPRLCRSFWKAFASTHPLMLPPTCSREALFACPPFPPWNLPSFTVESILSTPCSCSDPPLTPQGAALAHLDSLPPSWSGALNRRLCSFSFWQGRLRRSCQLLSLWRWDHSFLFGRPSMLKFLRWSLCYSARSLLVSAAPTSLPFLFSSPTVWLSFCPRRLVLPSIFLLISNSVAHLAGTVFSLFLFYQATTLVSPGERHGRSADQTGCATCAFRNPL